MNAKRMLLLALSMLLTANCALGAVLSIEAWIDSYNVHAAGVNAYALDKSMASDVDGYGFCEFVISDDTYLALYMAKGLETQAFMMETFEDDALAKGTFVSALAASDAKITVQSAADAFEKAERTYEKDVDGEYAYHEFDNWILIFSRDYDDAKSVLFSAFTVEAYEEMTKEEAHDQEPSGDEEQPDKNEEEPSNEGESEKKQENGKIHKL